MDITGMSLGGAVSLFGALIVLAAIPSVSVFAVTARAASSGFVHGAFTAMGIVIADIAFILLAVFGLALLVQEFGHLFFLVKYLGGAYLVWLGYSLWRAGPSGAERAEAPGSSLLSSFMTGLLITLGDQKAVLFYLGFLPAFVDVKALSYEGTAVIVAITVVGVGGVKLGYAYLAERAGIFLARGRTANAMNVTAAGVMVIAGVYLIATAGS